MNILDKEKIFVGLFRRFRREIQKAKGTTAELDFG